MSTAEAIPEAQPVEAASPVSTEPSSPSSTTSTPVSTTDSSPAPTKVGQPVRPAPKKKDKNDPTRFQGEGINFNAKLIGVDDVPEARGDRMCQDTIYRLKISVKASGQHKQRIIVNVSEEGIKLIDLRTGVVNYTHAVHKISFISRDMTDRRAFGYIFGVGDGTHKFFGIKTEKAAENLVLTLRDLFQIVYEKKKKEMEEAKLKQNEEEAQEGPPPEPENPNVLKLADSELNTESSTDDDHVYQVPPNRAPIPVEDSPEHIYAVPTNNAEVRKEERSLSNLVDLKIELETIEQGIEQMNKFESEFDALNGTVSPSEDPWAPSTTTMQQPESQNLFNDNFANNQAKPVATAGTAASDLQDIDLLGTQPATSKKKEEILNLFGPQQPQVPPQGFGAPPVGAPGFVPGFPGAPAAPTSNMGFNTNFNQPFPGTPAPAVPNPFGGPMPGFQPPAPVVNPFGPTQTGPLPPVPQRPGVAPGAPPNVAPSVLNNPFGDDPFMGGVVSSGGGGFASFSTATPSNGSAAGGFSLLDEPVLAPVKVVTEQQPPTTTATKGDAFGDLVNIGGTDTQKSPKTLFAELNAQPKKSVNELRSQQVQGGPPQASVSEDPFGSLDNASLPAIVDFSSPFQSKHLDPFDTSYLHSGKSNSPPCVLASQTASKLSFTEQKNSELCFSDNDDFNLPSPDGPPPPLPTVPRSSDPHQISPLNPPIPPRPNGSPALPPRNITTTPPVLPPRNFEALPKLAPCNATGNIAKQNTTISPVPRPRPRPQVNGSNSSPHPPQQISLEHNRGDTSNSNATESQKTCKSDNVNGSFREEVKHRFVVEDPFTTSDPFAETDPFSSSFDGFPNMCSLDSFIGNDPFIFASSSQSNQKLSGNSADDPFAVFDKSLNDSFSKGGNSRKNSKKRKSVPVLTDPVGDVLQYNETEDPVYAVVNKPKPKS